MKKIKLWSNIVGRRAKETTVQTIEDIKQGKEQL